MSVEAFTRIDERDFEMLNIGISALEPSERAGEALWLRSFEYGRQWIIETDVGCFYFQIEDHTSVPDEFGFIPIPERIRRFCNLAGIQSVDLAIADGHTIVATGGGLTAAIDSDGPYTDPPQPWTMSSDASMVVPGPLFADLLAGARTLPAGVRENEMPTPPLWLQISDDSVGLHVDWTEFGVSKATYRISPLHQIGDVLVALPHRLLDNALRTASLWSDLDEAAVDLTIMVGVVDEKPAITLETDSWSLLLWLLDPLVDRWAAAVDDAIMRSADVRVVTHDGSEWISAIGSQEVRLVLHHGHPDVARLSIPLVMNAEESIELLRELGQLNAASSGVRYWFSDDVVWSACDVPAPLIDVQLVPAIRQIAAAAALYRPMVAALAVGSCD